jgi:hypothetical protein
MAGVSRGCRVKLPVIDTRGHEHAAICRSGVCGHYDSSRDACGILTAAGKSGAVSWLYSHPDTGCADKTNPQF